MTTLTIPSTTDDLIAEIEAAMANATPGYWYQSKGIGVVVDHNDCGVVCETCEDNPVDAIYIAACNPSNVRQLIARIRELEQYKREAMQVMNPVLDYARPLNLAKWGESITQALIADHQRLVALERAQQWIPCSERLPEVRERLDSPLTSSGGHVVLPLNISVPVIYYDGNSPKSGPVNWFDGGAPINSVTHWMPLPEPPQ